MHGQNLLKRSPKILSLQVNNPFENKSFTLKKAKVINSQKK